MPSTPSVERCTATVNAHAHREWRTQVPTRRRTVSAVGCEQPRAFNRCPTHSARPFNAAAPIPTVTALTPIEGTEHHADLHLDAELERDTAAAARRRAHRRARARRPPPRATACTRSRCCPTRALRRRHGRHRRRRGRRRPLAASDPPTCNHPHRVDAVRRRPHGARQERARWYVPLPLATTCEPCSRPSSPVERSTCCVEQRRHAARVPSSASHRRSSQSTTAAAAPPRARAPPPDHRSPPAPHRRARAAAPCRMSRSASAGFFGSSEPWMYVPMALRYTAPSVPSSPLLPWPCRTRASGRAPRPKPRPPAVVLEPDDRLRGRSGASHSATMLPMQPLRAARPDAPCAGRRCPRPAAPRPTTRDRTARRAGTRRTPPAAPRPHSTASRTASAFVASRSSATPRCSRSCAPPAKIRSYAAASNASPHAQLRQLEPDAARLAPMPQAHDVAAVAVDVHQPRIQVRDAQRRCAHASSQNCAAPARFASSSRTSSIAVYVGTTYSVSPAGVASSARSQRRRRVVLDAHVVAEARVLQPQRQVLRARARRQHPRRLRLHQSRSPCPRSTRCRGRRRCRRSGRTAARFSPGRARRDRPQHLVQPRRILAQQHPHVAPIDLEPLLPPERRREALQRRARSRRAAARARAPPPRRPARCTRCTAPPAAARSRSSPSGSRDRQRRRVVAQRRRASRRTSGAGRAFPHDGQRQWPMCP